MSELAIVSAREARLKALVKTGSGGARTALALAADPGRFLSTVQIGITLIGVLAGAYSGARLGEPASQPLAAAGLDPAPPAPRCPPPSRPPLPLPSFPLSLPSFPSHSFQVVQPDDAC